MRTTTLPQPAPQPKKVATLDPADPLRNRVEQALARWKEKRQLLQAGSQALEIELERFTRGERSEPAELKRIVDELRVECDSLLQEVLAAARAAQAAGPG